jgi:hypothetical protein
MTTSRRSPSAVVLSAYRAANRGRYSEANRLLSARHRNSRASSAAGIRHSNRQIAAALPGIQSPAMRAQLKTLSQTMAEFEDPHFLWKGSTQGGSITAIDVIREVTRGARATVTLALRLADGRTRVERNKLRRTRDSWEIDVIEVEVLENNEMQLTKSARARRRGLRS